MMPFLYFPDDKSEYIPAVISLVIFMIGAGVALYLIYKYSKKQEKKFDEQYKNLKIEKHDDTSTTQ
ncbi:hypothetical protein [Ornithinibacillus bavariensis]|uniref:Uncharacterized protein n=1 Tax=Ornithinibacillus bavariensis TaxID=545502 RepID=A0A920C9K8_9BACI|nr:hypothetical protein [Ornithinibacillus bavariensis]GIO28617.1 hypothetical protein J43TS3_32280 [Ornithinibacillus bavariensis]HAM79310.1 hypothetical protein [Ornithinibacillus sp.]